MCQTVPVGQMTQLITDANADAAELDQLREAGVDILVAPLA